MRWPLTTSYAAAKAMAPNGGACSLAFALAGLAMVCPNQAFALGAYRDKVAEFAQVSAEAVPCATCHDDPNGGGPKNRPFYLTLEANGLKQGVVLATIGGALDAMEAKQTDSDGDAAQDFDELKAGTSPNDASSKPAQNNGGAGGATPPPPPPPPRAGSGGSNSGGRAGANSKPSAGASGDENALESEGGTTSTCSFGGINAEGGGASALLVGLAFLTRVRSRRSRGS